jgi:cysteine desulfurase / selenocysteine lyase
MERPGPHAVGSYSDAWREEFPSCRSAVHMNHAGISPIPRRVAAAVRTLAEEALLIDDGIYARWEARVHEVRGAFGRLIGARAEEIAFVRNTSEGLSLVANGCDWSPGDNVVLIADEFPANVYPWWGLAGRGVETRLVPRCELRFTVDDIAALVDRRTRVVSVSEVDWQSGFRANLASIGSFCQERGILFCVDGIQSVGALQVDVGAAAIDCLAAGGHKWLLAPEGCGCLFVAARVVEQLRPTALGWKSVTDAGRYLPYHLDLRPDAARFEAGSPAHLGVHALGAALDVLLEVGPRMIEERILATTAKLADGLRRRGATIVSPWGETERSGILNFRLGENAELYSALSRAGIICRKRLGGVRLAPHFYNDDSDVERVLEAVDDYRRRL